MKPRPAVYLAASIVGMALVLAFLFLSKSVRSSGPAQAVEAPAVASNLPRSPGYVSAPSRVNAASQTVDDFKKSPKLFQKFVDGKNLQINFAGTAIDQGRVPLAGVKVKGKIRQWQVAATGSLAYGGRSIPVEAQSDANGEFEIHGVQGDGIEIENIEKDGYKLEPNVQHAFGAWNSTERVVFMLWKDGVENPVVMADHLFQIVADGRRYSIDLVNWKVMEAKNSEGDLQFWIKRPSEAKFGEEYEWSFGLTAPAGGILEENAASFEEMLFAPRDGYKDNYESAQHQAAVQYWSAADAQKNFYVKARDGRIYGRLQVYPEPFADRSSREGSIRVRYGINPTGSLTVR